MIDYLISTENGIIKKHSREKEGTMTPEELDEWFRKCHEPLERERTAKND